MYLKNMLECISFMVETLQQTTAAQSVLFYI